MRKSLAHWATICGHAVTRRKACDFWDPWGRGDCAGRAVHDVAPQPAQAPNSRAASTPPTHLPIPPQQPHSLRGSQEYLQPPPTWDPHTRGPIQAKGTHSHCVWAAVAWVPRVQNIFPSGDRPPSLAGSTCDPESRVAAANVPNGVRPDVLWRTHRSPPPTGAPSARSAAGPPRMLSAPVHRIALRAHRSALPLP